MGITQYFSRLFGVLCIQLYSCLAATSTSTAATTTPSTTAAGGGAAPTPTPDPSQTTVTTVVYENFFDDPYNQATYIVLPIMILIYGGCSSIYCFYKLRRYMHKRARRKRRDELIENGMCVDEEVTEKKHNTFNNMAFDANYDDDSRMEYKRNNRDAVMYSEDTQSSFGGPFEPSAGAAKPVLQRGTGKMGYNIMPLPNSTEDPVMNANIDTHLKNAFAMIEHAARDIKMQQAMNMKSCPDRYPTEHENQDPIRKKGNGYKKKFFIAV